MDLQYLYRALFKSDVSEAGGPLIALKKTFELIAEELKQKYPTLFASCVRYLNSIEHRAEPGFEGLAARES